MSEENADENGAAPSIKDVFEKKPSAVGARIEEKRKKEKIPNQNQIFKANVNGMEFLSDGNKFRRLLLLLAFVSLLFFRLNGGVAIQAPSSVANFS